MAKKEEMTLNLSTGLKKIPVHFTDRDETDYIYINPTDKGLAIRFKNAQKSIEERLKAFENIALDADGMPENTDFIDDFEEMTNILYDEVDKAFNSKVCDVVFRYCSPFAVVNGEYYFLAFFEAITPIIQQYAEAENEKANASMNKYVSKYSKYIKR